MKKTLIIGGSGFIGSRLIDILDKSYIINFDKNKSFSHDNITFIGNILNKDDLKRNIKQGSSISLVPTKNTVCSNKK